jgi:hypothetical protein
VTERGTATTEAVVALPVIAVILGGLMHLRALLAAGIDVRSDARNVAWTLREAADCSQDADLRDGGGFSGMPATVADKVPGGVMAIFSYGRARGDASRTVALSRLASGDAAGRTLRARVAVTCNEPDHGGLLDALVGILRQVSGL